MGVPWTTLHYVGISIEHPLDGPGTCTKHVDHAQTPVSAGPPGCSWATSCSVPIDASPRKGWERWGPAWAWDGSWARSVGMKRSPNLSGVCSWREHSERVLSKEHVLRTCFRYYVGRSLVLGYMDLKHFFLKCSKVNASVRSLYELCEIFQ